MAGGICITMLAKSDGLGDYIFGLDPQLLLETCITILSMFCLFLFLSYILFNPARDLLQKRQNAIKDSMETAARDMEAATSLKQQYDEKLKGIDEEAEQILSETRKKALKKENDIVADAKEEANRIRERATREVELEKSKVKDEMKKEMITVATAMAGKIVSTSLDDKTQSKLIADTLEEMGDSTWLS